LVLRSEVDEDYIQDEFNLSGLNQQVPYYDYALDLILDIESPHEEMLTEEQHELVESAAEMLYGLIHQRFILTSRGLSAMYDKFKSVDFGRCPRVLCGGAACLPVGQADVPRTSTVKIFCPKCEDIYYPRSKLQGNIDGAYFGTTFPHLFLMTYSHLRSGKQVAKYVPKVFGFKIHPSSQEVLSARRKEKKGERSKSSQKGAHKAPVGVKLDGGKPQITQGG